MQGLWISTDKDKSENETKTDWIGIPWIHKNANGQDEYKQKLVYLQFGVYLFFTLCAWKISIAITKCEKREKILILTDTDTQKAQTKMHAENIIWHGCKIR